MMGRRTDEIIEELFKALLQRYQKGLEESIKVSLFLIVFIYGIKNFIKSV